MIAVAGRCDPAHFPRMSEPYRPLPVRRNLVVECVRVLRMRMASGEWGQFLPGERRLAETLRVGRDTIRLTLQQLEEKGEIAPAAAGMRRRILRLASPGRTKPTQAFRVGMISIRPLEQLPQPMLLEVDQIRGALAERRGSLHFYSPPWFGSQRPEKHLVELVRNEDCSVWILHRSSAVVQQWFADHAIPCLVRGYPHAGIELPFLDVDWEATARHAAATLWRLGHRRVAVFSPPDMLRGVKAAINGVCQFSEPGFTATVLPEDGSATGIARVLAPALRAFDAPTALVASRPRQAASALTWLATQGLRVPAEISLISLAHEPFLDHLVPAISGYHTAPDRVARLVSRKLESLLAGQTHPGGSPWITPDFVRGESIGPPPGA